MIMTILASTAIFIAGDNPDYDARLDPLVGQTYRAAVEMLGMPEARDLRDAGGEIWTFRSRSSDNENTVSGPSSLAGFTRQRSVARTESTLATPAPASGPGGGTGGSGAGSGGSVTIGSTDTGAGISATRHRAERICTTLIAINPDGTIAGYSYQGRCPA